MTVKLLTEHYLEFLSLKGGCTGSSESTLVKMPHCWKSRVTAQIISTAILLKKGCCQVQGKYVQYQACPGKKVWLGELTVPT